MKPRQQRRHMRAVAFRGIEDRGDTVVVRGLDAVWVWREVPPKEKKPEDQWFELDSVSACVTGEPTVPTR